MPGITGPDPFGVVALDQLHPHHLDPQPGLDRAAGQARQRSLGRARRRGQQPHPLLGQQAGSGPAPIGPVTQHPAVGVGHQVLGQGEVVEVGRGEVAVSDHPRPAHPEMGSEAVEGLLGALITAEGGQPGQPPAAIGPAEAADRHREAVQDRDGRAKPTWPRSCWRSWALTAHRFAAWRTKVVRYTRLRVGNQSPQWQQKCSYRPLSVSMPQNSPTHSMVKTSLSARIGLGPRWRSCRPPSQSSIRQYTVISSVVASMADPRTRGDGLTTKRTGVTTTKPHTGLATWQTLLAVDSADRTATQSVSLVPRPGCHR